MAIGFRAASFASIASFAAYGTLALQVKSLAATSVRCRWNDFARTESRRSVSVRRGDGLTRAHAAARQLVLVRGADERGKERMRLERGGLEFGMELAAEEPRVVGVFDDFHVHAVGRAPGDAESRRHQRLFVLRVELVTVAMPLGNFRGAVGARGKRPRLEHAGPRAQAHRSAHFFHAPQVAQ